MRLVLLIFSLLFCLAVPSAKSAKSEEPLDIGSRRELFVDRFLIEDMKGVGLQLKHPLPGEVILKANQPWEGAFNWGNSIINDNGFYHLYYQDWSREGKPFVCYASSRDGVSWKKPSLGLFEFEGSRDNNIIVDEKGESVRHNEFLFAAFLDTRPGIPKEERIKGIVQDGRRGPGHIPHVIGYTSADGVRFKRMEQQPQLRCTMHNCFDGDFASFWSQEEQAYVAYFRFMDPWRSVLRSTSKDFVYWTPLKVMNYGPTTREHLYLNRTSPYFRAPHIFVALAARLVNQRRGVTDHQLADMEVVSEGGNIYYNGCSDTVFMTTRPGSIRYDRTFMDSFVRPGIGPENWVTRTNFALSGIIQTGPTEMSFYVSRHYALKSWHIQRQILRLDGFTSINAPYEGGEMRTRPFRFSGRKLRINYSTSAAGSVQVELQHSDGTPVDGFAASDCPEIVGDQVDRVVSWTRGSDLGKMVGKPVRLRFIMKDADLYSLRFK